MRRSQTDKKRASEGLKSARAIIDGALNTKSHELLLRHLDISQVPDSIYELTHLRILDLAGNQLTNCDLDFTRFPELEVLDLSVNRLKSLPASVGKLDRLRLLYIERNELKTLPLSIGKLAKLEQLTASNNRLSRLPSSIGRLLSLRILAVENNELTEIPISISKLRSLESLRLSGNKLELFPKGLEDLPHLRELAISDNSIKTWLPEQLSVAPLLELDVSKNKLTELPEALGRLPKLQSLRLRGNLIREPSNFIVGLPRLELVDLSLNGLTSLQKISEYGRLANLNLSGNELTEIPEGIGMAKQLCRLDVSSNGLATLPSAIGELSNLETLEARRNRLTHLPPSIGNLPGLRHLDLAENALIELPDSFIQLHSLNDLDLRRNEKLGLPPEVLIGAKPDDKQIFSIEDFEPPGLLDSLPLMTRRGYERLLKQGERRLWDLFGDEHRSTDILSEFAPRAHPSEVLEYYFRVRSGRRPLNEAKLILLGRGGVGKTSLVRRLVQGVFEPDQPMTEGIEITKWSLALNESEVVRLNIWDFGGQEILHATHQFFLTQRALYLVVLNGREGGIDSDAEYWLRLIDSLGGESPVIVVLNKSSSNPFTVNRRFLEHKFPAICGFIETDCSDGMGIESLRRTIEDTTDRLPHLRAGFPASWFAIKDELSSSTRSYLTFADYRAVCARLGETNAGAQESLASYLHSLGIALNYKDDPRLQDTHVLNPHWVTNGIYKILNSGTLQRQKGELRLAQVQEILEPDLYPPEMHRFLLDLMSKFEVCFNFPDDSFHYLVPELLDNQEPAGLGDLIHRPRLEFQYHYPILPEGLLPRFIVRTHNMSLNSERWRTGVVLKFEDNVALVRADVQDKKIFISVSGTLEFQRPFLAVLRSHLNDLHRAIPKLAPIEMVPLPKYPYVVVPYDELRVMEREGIRTFPKVIDSQAIQCNVKQLLNGVDAIRPLHGGVIRPEEPFSNIIKLRSVLRASEEYIYWVDLHFAARALEEIAISLDPDAVQTIKILSGPANVTERARKDFARFQTELSRQNVSAEWRLLEHFSHDRFIITKNACHNVPPVNSLLQGSYSEILATPNRPPFEEWWEKAKPI